MGFASPRTICDSQCLSLFMAKGIEQYVEIRADLPIERSFSFSED